MIQRLFSRSRRKESTRLFTRHRKFTHERLEPRMMMTINPTGAEALLNDVVPGFQGMDGNVSSVAVSEAAGTIAAYSGLGAGTREGIFLRRTDSSGVQSDVVPVSTTIRGSRSDAAVAANDVGNTVIVWHGRGLGDKYGIYLQRFNASGDPLGGEQLVNETVGGEQVDPSVAMAGDGSFVVTWSGANADDRSGVYARRYDVDGVALGGEELVNSTTVDHQSESSIAMNATGDYVITWSSNNQDGDAWGVYGQRFNSAGVRQGDEFALNSTTAASQRESSVAMQDDGTFMVVWSSFGQDGDSWAVVGRQFDASGTPAGDEFIVNTSTAGHQRHAQVAGAAGKYLVAWQSGVPGGTSGWEVMSQEFDASGAAVGSELTVNSLSAGAHSGNQQHPAVALNSAGRGAIVWSGLGTPDRNGAYGRGFLDDDPREENLAPDLATIDDVTVEPSTELTVTVTATDPNEGDTLTYQLDPTTSPASATIERTDNNTAVIRWTPTSADANSVVSFRVLVTDNGVPPLADAEEFQVNVTDGGFTLDLNGSDEAGSDTSASFAIGLGPASILPEDLLLVGAVNDTVSRVSIVIQETPNGSREILEVDQDVLASTNITANYNSFLRRLFLGGDDSAENYLRVLRTLTYNNTAADPSGTRTVEIQANEANGRDSRLSNMATVTIDIGDADLVGFAQAISAAFAESAAVQNNAGFYGAAWCPFCTDQKELFEDGGQFLPFIEVTNPDRTINTIGDANDIVGFPTWIFPDGTRSTTGEVLSLAAIAERSGVSIPVSNEPFIAPVSEDTLLVGSPLHVSLDGYDPNGGPLTYTVTTNRPDAIEEARILSGNRSARINVAGYGDLVFELFEQRATRPSERFIELAESDFYNDIIFHRVISDFVIQGGDPLGTGTGGSTLGDFDDQFHIDLQHNRSGLLSYAKSADDTNDSQFFITEGGSTDLRNLDFNHSIFGVLVEGESNRAAISDTEVIRRASEVPRGDRRADRPGRRDTGQEFNITMENVEIFEDRENAVLFLKANDGVTGEVMVTVTVEDQEGNTFDHTFTLALEQDQDDFVETIPGAGDRLPFNGRPFLGDIGPVSIAMDSTAEIHLTSMDVESDPVAYSARNVGAVAPTLDVSDSGLLTVTPPTGFTGVLEIEVSVNREVTVDLDSPDFQLITIDVT